MFNVAVGNPTEAIQVHVEDGKTSYARFRILENRRTKNEAGEYEDLPTLGVWVKVFGRAAENLAERASTKTQLVVVGNRRLDTWVDKDGNDRTREVIYATEVGLSVRF